VRDVVVCYSSDGDIAIQAAEGVVPRRPERAPGQQQPALFTDTDLPIERLRAVLRTLPYAETWRWRVLLPPRGERFIVSDRGLCEFGDLDLRTGKDWPSHGVFFPLEPTLGVLGFLHEPTLRRRVFRPLDFSERLTLNRRYTALLNLRLWEDAERFVRGRGVAADVPDGVVIAASTGRVGTVAGQNESTIDPAPPVADVQPWASLECGACANRLPREGTYDCLRIWSSAASSCYLLAAPGVALVKLLGGSSG
jgi:hypothetical protein